MAGKATVEVAVSAAVDSTRWQTSVLAVLCLWLWTVCASAAEPRQQVMLVTGISGEPFYAKRFARVADSTREVMIKGLRVAEHRFHHFSAAAEHAQRSTRENVLAKLAQLATKTGPNDQVLLILVGHGSARGDRIAFNLPGPDLQAAQLAGALDAFPPGRLVVVVATSSSGSFLPVLSASGRIVVTATASARENQYPVFVEPFVAAFASSAADINKDKRVSLLEAFRFARVGVLERYEKEQLMVVEHALLDDNGDREGSTRPGHEPGDKQLDGAHAEKMFFDITPAGSETRDIAALIPLKVSANQLLERIATLKREKNKYFPEEFYDRLEVLLVELAVNRRAYRQALRGERG